MSDLGTAILKTAVDLKDLLAGLKDAEAAAEKGGEKAGAGLGKGLAAGVAGATAALVATVGLVVATAFNFASDSAQAQRELQAQLGITAEAAAELGDVAEDVFLRGFGDGIADVNQAVGEVRRQLGELSGDEMADVTEAALKIRDTFGVDVGESVNAAKTLMQNFGLSSQEAMDFIVKGYQRGLNSSDDFLDTIGEYSVQFANGEATAEQFFSLLESGLQGGMLGTDKAADAFKEFGLRIGDGSASTAEALDAIGINADELWASMSAGETTTADAFQSVIAGLNGIEDPLLRNAVGTALLGTQYEDLGANAVLGLSLATTSMEDMAGATDSLGVRYETFGQLWTVVSRALLVAIAPIGEALLSLASAVMPVVLAAIAALQPIIGNLLTVIQTVFTYITQFLTENVTATAAMLTTNWSNIQATITAASDAVWLAVQTAFGFVSSFLAEHGDSIMTTLRMAWETIALLIDAAMIIIKNYIIPAFTAIMSAINSNSDTIKLIIGNAWTFISSTIQAALTLIQGVVKTVLALLEGDFSGAWGHIQSMSEQFVRLLWQAISAGLDNVKLVWSLVWEEIKVFFQDIMNSITGWTIQTMQAVANSIRQFAGAAKSAAGAVADGIVGGIAEGIKDGASKIANAAKDAAMAALNAAKKALGIASPSKRMRVEIGQNAGESVALGISESIPDVAAAANRLSLAAFDAADLNLDSNVVAASSAQSNTYNLTAQYGYQNEKTLRDDVRMLQLLGAT